MKWRVVMLRKLAVFIVSAGLLISPLSVQALGFGGIKLKSSLNEKLNAEVDLVSATANDIQSLTIKLATEEAFLRAGIDRTAQLNKLKFDVKERGNGDYYISITSTESMREPFMNFLLEMNWKNGRMLREYTMLIDPPGRGAPRQLAEPAPVVAETTAPEAEPVSAESVAEVKEQAPFVEPVAEPAMPEIMPEPVVEAVPAAEKMETQTEAAGESAEQAAPVVDIPPEVVAPEEAAQTEEPAIEYNTFEDDGELWPRIPLTAFGESADAAGGEMGDLDYGITKKNDNLWKIAEKLRQGDKSVSVYQVMMALLKNNPDAFIDNNVHRLKVGHVLRIADPSALTAMSRKEAAESYIAQSKSWNNYRQQAADNAGVQPIMAGEAEAAPESAITKSKGELTLASPDGETLTAGGGANEEALSNDLATIQDQLRQAKTDAGTMRTRNVALNNKLQSLEDELNRLQRSLTVKDDELAALQQQLANLNKQPAAEPVTEKADPAPVKPVVEDEPAKAEAAVVAEPVVKEVVKPEAEVKPEVKEPAAEPVVKKAKPAVVTPPPAPVAEPDIMDTIMGVLASVAGVFAGINLGSDSLLFIAAPIALVILILVFIVYKRRRQGDNFQESILTGAAKTSAADAAGGMPSGDSTTFSEESSFLSDFAMSGASAIEADDAEVDPLTEADVFMAYGRYEAAEERLNEAVQNDPDRMELRAKLLELHHATKNKTAFENAAEDFYAALGGAEAGNPLWEKIVSMGKEIAPANPLFSQGGADDFDIPATSETAAINDPGMGMTDSQVMDIGLETGVFAAADFGAPAADDDMDFVLDLGESAAAEPEAASSEMDFNLDIGGGEPAAEDSAPDLNFDLDMGSSEEPDNNSLDFNLDIGGDSAAEASSPDMDFNLDMASSDESDGNSLDFNLDIGGGDEPAADLNVDSAAGNDDFSLDMDLNLDASDTADADISGGDEVGTKLDLAKAYIDMGDPEGARSILDEVMDEGSSKQKEEAQALLGQIA